MCDLVVMMLDRCGIGWRAVDIDNDPELAREYGIHIPVLRDPGTGKELHFPFDDKKLRVFMEGKT